MVVRVDFVLLDGDRGDLPLTARPPGPLLDCPGLLLPAGHVLHVLQRGLSQLLGKILNLLESDLLIFDGL